MEELVSYISNFLNVLLREINEIKNETTSALQPIIHDGKALIRVILSRSTYETILANARIHLHHLYMQLIIIPRSRSFYIQDMSEEIQRYARHVKTWDRNHLIAGAVGFFIGTLITRIIGQTLFVRTRYFVPMKSVVIKNEKVQGINYFEDASVPIINEPDEILIHVRAASVDPVDLDIASGLGKTVRDLFFSTVLKKKDKYPITLGRDCAGTIIDIGRGVTKFEAGDEVWVAVPYWMPGTLSEYISVKECFTSHKPERLGFLDAASLPYSGCIAIDCVKNRAGLVDYENARGKRIMVHCGNTAVGIIIIQLCSIYNVSITTSCVSQAVNKMLDAGAQNILLLDQVSPDLPPARKYDIVFNTLGHIADDFCANLVTDDGILIDASSEYYVPRNANGFFYSTWLRLLQKFGYRLWDTAIINSNALDELCELVNEGKLYPITDSVFKAKSCERAFWLLNSSKTVGKPVIYFNSQGEFGFR